QMSKGASFVLIGEASHGTHEFYATRAELTRRLIEEQGFNAVVVEGNWAEAYRVDRFVRGLGSDTTAEQALSDFDEFPEWMWRNTDVRDFLTWLRGRNKSKGETEIQAGFYGMDLYGVSNSRAAVRRYSARLDSKAAEGGAALASTDPATADAAFDAQQNARVVKNGEEYNRKMYDPTVNTWNLRDRHMADTLDALAAHLRKRDGYARIAVWAHNSHLGDARATESRRRGEWNLGQLVRERHPNQAVLVGFSTSTGTVMAASDWGERAVVKKVQPAMPSSYERVFHESGIPAFVLSLRNEAISKEFSRPLLERAIGVIYRPQTERQSHYFEARLAQQFDVVIHFQHTRAVQPLGNEGAS
ncbi:MAG TPA: erythromycin esterase family protein, partial [Bryobacteraceae bacterium]|nr:erythromycin esterase family protein [Bryobacteraceae bacterium]